MKNEEIKSHIVTRPPVVVVMGHVDHGKSTLLDYIRKSNIVAGESGGITQHISAYEVKHKDESGNERLVTFLDTPGHEAFSQMRTRGAQTADIAILVVSAEDGVKAQTMEAYETIISSKIPYIVAINKIDKENANAEKTKMDLAEKGIYLEGMGGNIPYVLISAKEGTGINDLLDMIILVADMEEFTGNTKINAIGVIIEANRDPKRGVSGTCIIKDGTLKSGMFVA
ncbi:MAG: GTP-binding protein [Candidatus Pacebacteria bacterium]|nr:GTP-binding protein [Candidatus Paceibacterota bacterium]